MSYHPVAWQKERADLVKNEIEVILQSMSDQTAFRDIVRESLAGFKRGITRETAHKPWFLLPVAVFEAITGHYQQAISASAALQLFMAAAGVFDDIEDADAVGSLPDKYGVAIAANTGTVLLLLAEQAITRLKAMGVADSVIVGVTESFNRFFTVACCGQHLDLSYTPETTPSEDTYLEIAYMKSATTIECACYVGAALAQADEKLVASFNLIGRHIGMASQIANDIDGITSGSDIVKRKITLPVIYALAQTEGEAYNQLKAVYTNQTEPLSVAQTQDLLFRCGAIEYATIQMETYKQNASDILGGLERANLNVDRLKWFFGLGPKDCA